jgi:ribonuclease HI
MDYSCDSLWIQNLWKWPVPLKIKLFIWLSAKGKVLTWEVLRKKGWEGPGVCKLCNCSSEDIHHLLIHCNFTKVVWQHLINFFSLNLQWNGSTVSDCFTVWSFEKSVPVSLAALACWHIWIERNKVIFEDRSPSLFSVVHRILDSFSWQPVTQKVFPNKVCEISQAEGYTLACFDGAAQSNGLCCGAGGTFKTHPSRITKWFINCGAGSNTKAELMGLWVTLTLATIWSINKLQILGDSKVIIDWINQIGNLQAVNIDCWKQKMKDLAKNFKDISFQHIYRVHNKEADLLSKRVLNEIEGRLTVYHRDNGEESPLSILNIFEM